MPRKKPAPTHAGDERSMPARQTQDEVLNDLDAEVDPETGETLVDEDRLHEVGAVDADAVRENQRRDTYLNQKKAGVKKVPFNTPDVLQRYEIILTQYPANTLHIYVRRLTGAPTQHVITSFPKSGVELYAAMEKIHGASDSAEYELKIQDANQRTYRGTGRITMPDTRDRAQVFPQPVSAAGGYHPSPQPPAPPPPPPAAAPPSAGPGPADTVALAEQFFSLFQRMQPPPPPAAPAPAPVATPPQMPSAQQMLEQIAPLLSNPTTKVEDIGRLFELFQRATQTPQQVAAASQAAQPPPGMVHVPGIGFVTPEYVMQLSRQQAEPPQRRPYTPPRRPYEDERRVRRDEYPEERYPRDDRYDRRDEYEPRYGRRPPPPPPERDRSPLRDLRDAISTVKEMRHILGEDLGGIEPHRARGRDASADEDDDDDSPLQVVEVGGAKYLRDKETGNIRLWESAVINAPTAFKWIGEMAQEISKAATERQQQQHQAAQQSLPQRRFVEVIDPDPPQPPLRPPPEQVPPPINPEWGDVPSAPWEAGEESS